MYERLRRELAYIQGLLEGTQKQDSIEQKALGRLVDIIDELIEATQQMDKRQLELEEYVEAIDDDLNDLELVAYEDEEEMLELICPECGEHVLVDSADVEDETMELLCPKCHTVLDIEDVSDQEENDTVEDGEGI
ncbi:CD1247 N-terminal domain-containing protein [Lihuaxuella thermophila]|uniref:MJ0042 family finger-like domain-containing protein n=1 Tax=Lihuaxuella thermophila TaxID=1173111 RepID=A0A1H8ETR9_9BACL|nr:CD1247 N-terminal domain-containing protein [Lihuaxuella thermophila]SEN23001.1 hypothetical protein SAMN05444955_107172 [Lihuaxuella thermophila]